MVVAASAIVAKEFTSRRTTPALAVLDPASTPEPVGEIEPVMFVSDPLVEGSAELPEAGSAAQLADALPEPEPTPGIDTSRYETDLGVRWFNGRPVRAARTIWMTVTAYSPDARSCGDSADGITASLHRVETNRFRLVAADSRVLPLGSIISIPGYASEKVVPVLDRGGKIKGNRLDLLFPDHEQARAWGVKKLKVTVWEYADGNPAPNWRAIRDSR